MGAAGGAEAAAQARGGERPARGSGVRGPGPSRQRLAFDTARADTRGALRRLVREDRAELARWLVLALAVGLVLLAGALAVAQVTGGPRTLAVPVFADPTAGASDALRIAASNAVVLLLHVLVCVATYLAVRSLAVRARRSDGTDRVLREVVSPLAVAVVGGLTLVSIASQAWRLGHELGPAAATLNRSVPDLLARVCLHAVPELTGIFLPLAACLVLVRARRFHDLLGAAALSAIVGLPLILAAACCEVWATRWLL